MAFACVFLALCNGNWNDSIIGIAAVVSEHRLHQTSTFPYVWASHEKLHCISTPKNKDAEFNVDVSQVD